MPRRTNSKTERNGEQIIDVTTENSMSSSNSSNFSPNPII